MRKIVSILVLLFVVVPPTFTQQNEVDSLRNLLTDSDRTERVNLFIEISELFNGVNIDSALYYANRSLSIANRTSDKELLAKSNFNLSKILIKNYESSAAMEYIKKAEELYIQLGNLTKQAEVYNAMSLIYYDQSDFAKSLELTEKALKIGQGAESLEEMAQAYFYMANIYNRLNDSEKSLESYLKALDIRKDLEDSDKIAGILNNIGGYYSSRADYKNAIVYYDQALEIRRELGVKKSIGIVLNNLGNQYLQLGEPDKAIDNYREASEIFKEIKFNRGTAATLTGMAIIYESLSQFSSALEVYQEVLEIREQENSDYELGNTLSNIAITYSRIFNDSILSLYGANFQDSILNSEVKLDIESGRQAVSYNLQALEKRTEIGDNWGLSITLANLGTTYLYLGDYEKAEVYFTQWLELPIDFHDDDTQVAIQIGLGKMSMFRGDYNTARVYFELALRIAEKINKKTHISMAMANLSEIYEREGNYEKSLQYHKQYFQVYEILNKERTTDQISEMQVKYETEAKEKENELLRKDQLINETKLRNSRTALVAAILVVLIFVALIIQLIKQNAFRRKANLELAEKNRLITEQTKEITDSIQYASRIQNAILPPEEYINNLISDQFILYRPRDIVSGDYYWMTEKNGKIITMVADCTGHGVPGAFMSMLGVAFLNEIVSKHDFDISADLILNELRAQIIESLHQTGREGENQDGMDVSLYILDMKEMMLEYAGANNPLLIFRDDELIELKPDKMPIGIHTRAKNPFNRQQIKIKEGDMLYSFSDGYPDQFGGPQDKKFMIKNFKKLLAEVHRKDLSEQKRILEKTLDNWMADTNQIDDILVMGVRI